MADTTQEFTVDQNNGYIAPVNGKSHPAAIDEAERQALALQTTIKVSQSGAEEAERKQAGNKNGSAEASLYGNLITHALGIGGAGAVAEFVDARRTDKAHGIVENNTHSSKKTRTIDQDIKSAAREPGLYREEAKQSVYGSAPVADRFIKKTGGDIFAGAMIAGDVLKKQPKDATSTWKNIDPSHMMSGVKKAKEVTYSQEIANKAVLDSAIVARKEQSAELAHRQQMAPGLGGGGSMRMFTPHLDLHKGPRPPDARAYQEDDSSKGALN